MKSSRTRSWLAGGLLALGLAGAASAAEDGPSFFASLRKAYSERPSYGDVGEIEITESFDGLEDTQAHFFETSATRGAALVWRVMLVSEHGLEDRAVWLTGDSIMVYDGGLEQTKPAPTLASAFEEILGADGGKALLVPFLLGFEGDSEVAAVLARSSSLTDSRPCFQGRECRVLSAELPDGGSIKITVETGTYWIHDVEVSVPGEFEATTFRVHHSESSLDVGAPEARVDFSPPESALQVEDWIVGAEPRPDGAAPRPEFFDVVTVDLVTVSARIVTSTGYPIPDLRPADLIATVGGRELPVAAVDWYGSTPIPSDPRRAGEAGEPPASSSSSISEPVAGGGRLVVLFLQNDFEPTRVKGHMKLFPGLLRLVDNLAPEDRVAVLSFYAHLKLWQDFTTDKQAVKDSLERAFFPGATPPTPEPGGRETLLDSFDPREARDVATSVAAMRYTADALAALPGEKDVVFIGYGLEGPRASVMLRALQTARATTFIVDTTQANGHTLGVTLVRMARATGGTYSESFVFADRSLRRIERMLRGHYAITIDRSRAPDARGDLKVRLRNGEGFVLMKPSRIN